jgi:hypothetical protein
MLGSLFFGVKWLEHEANHWAAFIAEVKNAWRYNSIIPICLMVWG